MSFRSEPLCVLLTATVNVRGTAYVTRTDPIQRLRDSEWALQDWLTRSHSVRVVFCENSGWDLTSLHRLVQMHGAADRVELLSFCGEPPGHRGKGYGELEILRFAAENSVAAREAPGFLKVTGRYRFHNAPLFVRAIQQAQPDVMASFGHGLTWADSRVFGGTFEFLQRYLFPLHDRIDDSRGFYMEHALAVATHLAIAEGRVFTLPPALPDLEGYYGTSNTQVRPPAWRRIAKQMYFRLKTDVYKRHP